MYNVSLHDLQRWGISHKDLADPKVFLNLAQCLRFLLLISLHKVRAQPKAKCFSWKVKEPYFFLIAKVFWHYFDVRWLSPSKNQNAKINACEFLQNKKKFQEKSTIKTSTKDRTDMEVSIPELGSTESRRKNI